MAKELNGAGTIEWANPSGCPDGFETASVVTGRSLSQASAAMEIATARWIKAGAPRRESLVRLHALRVNKRATPVVLLVEMDNGTVILLGPSPEAAPFGPLPGEQAGRILQAVLDEPTPIAARARLTGLLQSLDSTSIPGVKNAGLFANQELRVGVPQRSDWWESCLDSTSLLSDRGEQLIEQLGYRTGRAGAHALLLSGTGPRPEAIAVMLDERETFDSDSQRFSISPVAYGLKMAEQQGVSWLILSRGSQLRLYPARIDMGVGRKGLAETFLEIDLPQLTAENSGYLSLIFSASALADGGSAFQIMTASAQYAVALGARLRDQVYEDIVPGLSVAVADQLVEHGHEMDIKGLDLAYQLTLRIFFRMLFQVYAEDRKLLPYGENPKYDRHALKTIARDLVEDPDADFDDQSTAYWDDLGEVWRVIDSGDKAWGVPPYNGGLFTSDPQLNEHGSIINTLRISNDVMGPVLKALLLDKNDEDGDIGPIDFRSLSVREFGTIYEGLLESSLALAEVDLTLDEDGTWLPATKRDQVVASAGQVYFHNTSGQRKGTGSYFTPSFVVEHLLERSLDTAMDDHLSKVAEKISDGDQAAAADLFFDFRVADLSMGSGHFLTSAIDHIEAKMAAFLAEDGHQIPGVTKELILLGSAARDAIGPDAPEPEPSSLLRRQIARRCIYGLDMNPIAVELARVSIWIHTFVRGLPMSSLDHNLVCANSLTGIGSIDEALDVLVPNRNGAATLFDAPIEDALNAARTVLVDAALMPELNRNETQAASRAVKRASREAERAKLLFDGAVLARMGRDDLVDAVDPGAIAEQAASVESQEAVRALLPGHMPVLFPEVFLRDNAGFDVLVGNPPWKQLMVDELRFWMRAEPGMLALRPAELKKKLDSLKKARADLIPAFEAEVEQFDLLRESITSGPFPGVGGGGRAPDLYLAFAWRNWQLIRENGRVAAVFPRTLLSAAVPSAWREAVLASGEVSVVTLTNSGEWVFTGVDGRYSLALVNLVKTATPSGVVGLCGPFYDLQAFLEGREVAGQVPVSLLTLSTTGASFPQLPDTKSTAVFTVLRTAPRLSEGIGGTRFAPVYEFNATTDRPVFDAGVKSDGRWPVFGGSSFNIWEPETGEVYAWANPKKVVGALQQKRKRQIRLSSSAFFGMSERWAANESTLPCMFPRIAFRDVARATDSRTCVVALIAGARVLVNQAPYLLRLNGSEADEAYLLGVMSSIPLDWYARRYVELHLNFQILNGLPIPSASPEDPSRIRVIEVSGRLAARDDRFADWAKAVGVPVGSVTTAAQQSDMEAELNALVAHLYGLSRVHLQYVFATFHRGWDYKPYLDAALRHFDKIMESA